jgi:uncharacterized membrane protein YbhN (UPF0104 family)
LAVPAVALVFLAVALAGIPGRFTTACATWVAAAVGLEVLSVLGFVTVFKLVFGQRMSWRQNLGAGLRAVGATSLLPAGTLIGPALGARSSSVDVSRRRISQSSVAFALLVALPALVVLGAVAFGLWLGLVPGPHDVGRTLPAVAVALTAVAVVLSIPTPARSCVARSQPTGRALTLRLGGVIAVAQDGVRQTRHHVATGGWKVGGALGYYAFDNAVLWAAYHAYGGTPSLSVVVMGYLVGSLGSLVPLPAGIGAAEGGLIGALLLYGAPLLPTTGAVLLYRGVSLLVPVGLSIVAWALTPVERFSRGGMRRIAPPGNVSADLRSDLRSRW